MDKLRSLIRYLNARPKLLMLAAAGLTVLWSLGELTRSVRFVDEDLYMVAGSLLIDALSNNNVHGEYAAHLGPITTGPLVTVPAVLSYRLAMDFRLARLTQYAWVALLALSSTGLILAQGQDRAPSRPAAIMVGAGLLALMAVPHHIIEIPQILGETAAAALALSALAIFVKLDRWGPPAAGLLLGLAIETKLFVAPLAVLLILVLLLFDRRSLAPLLASLAAVWLAWTVLRSWQLQDSILNTAAAELQQMLLFRGSGLRAAGVGLVLARFQELEYANWPWFLKLHLWVLGASSALLSLITLQAARRAPDRVTVSLVALAWFVLAGWAWFTWLSDTMFIRHAVVPWLLFVPLLVRSSRLVENRWLQRAALGFLIAHLALGAVWIAHPRRGALQAVTNPSGWWLQPEAGCDWSQMSCSALPAQEPGARDEGPSSGRSARSH